MTKGEFKYLLNATFARIFELTATKGEEYAGSEDQLANFKRSAMDAGLTGEQVWLIFYNKHADAIKFYVKNLHTRHVPSEPIEGRIDDAILYLCLLKGLIRERTGLQEQADPAAERKGRPRPAP